MTNNTYEQGYADGFHGVAANAALVHDENYSMGYDDGKGDRESGADTKGVKSAFIGEDFYLDNDPPEGYEWTHEHVTPAKGEIYLTKAGNAGVAKTDPKNGRLRHLLVAKTRCNYPQYRGVCKFAAGHQGKCSHQLVK
jgi:hypothetical protein